MFCKHNCARCSKLAEFLNKEGISFVRRTIDADPDAETEALMLGIFAAPALKKRDKVLGSKELFNGSQMQKDRIRSFVQD
jgi:hypothetical protein